MTSRIELAAAIAARHKWMTAADSEAAVKTILAGVAATLASGGRVEIRGFGTFSARERPGRWARNPKTGEQIQVEAKRVPHFKPSRQLQDTLKPLG